MTLQMHASKIVKQLETNIESKKQQPQKPFYPVTISNVIVWDLGLCWRPQM